MEATDPVICFVVCVAIMFAFCIGCAFGESMNFMYIKNAPHNMPDNENWTYYDDSNTMIHCACADGNTVDIITYGNIPSTAVCGWFTNGTRLY